MILKVAALVLCLSISGVTAEELIRGYGRGNWWMDLPYEDDSYNVRQEFLKNATLACYGDVGPYEVDYWVLPDTRVITKGERMEFSTLDGTSSWEVSSDGRLIHITMIHERQFGFYYCHVKDSGQRHVIKKALNYKGAYFTDLWDKYKDNTMVGLIAAGSLLLIIVVCWVIYEFRYIPYSERPSADEDDDKIEGFQTGEEKKSAHDVDDDKITKPMEEIPAYSASRDYGFENKGFHTGEGNNSADYEVLDESPHGRNSVSVHTDPLVGDEENVTMHQYDGDNTITSVL